MDNIDPLCQSWLEAKRQEREATENRRVIEDQLIAALGIQEDQEGVQSADTDNHKVKVTGRISRKVDAGRVQEIAAEHGLSDMLPNLFRWRPEINASVWKATDAALTKPLLDAIEAKPGRPSFSIEKKETE
jgi:hypothetical protein